MKSKGTKHKSFWTFVFMCNLMMW